MYARTPDPNRQGVKIPENYGGHAFSRSGAYSDMPPPARVEPYLTDDYQNTPPEPYPSPQDTRFEPEDTQQPQGSERLPLPTSVPTDREQAATGRSIFSSLIPPSASASAHFPFGHGIGSEELLIIALMLTVYLAEGESADSELLLLLGLLLFAG